MSGIYAAARYYDIAFNWRDVRAECEFMVGRCLAARGRPPERAVELACGPGRHARTLAAMGIVTTGLDESQEMLDYAKRQPGGEDPEVRWQAGDIQTFDLPAPVDLACCLMDSLSHLLTLDALLAHLRAVARNVREGALYVIEQSHPRDAFPEAEVAAETAWVAEDESGEIRVQTTWGLPTDPFDYTTQIGQLTVRLRAEREGETIFTTEQIVPSRLWLAGEMEAAIRLAGGWTLLERFGAMDPSVPWQSEAPAWRMVTVLQRGTDG